MIMQVVATLILYVKYCMSEKDDGTSWSSMLYNVPPFAQLMMSIHLRA